MTLTTEEKRLINLYCSGSAAETAAVIRDALEDITETHDRSAAVSVLCKLEGMTDAAYGILTAESGCCYE